MLYRASNAILNAREARETSATLTMYPGVRPPPPSPARRRPLTHSACFTQSADDDDALLLTSHDFTPPPTARLESCTPADLVALRVLYEDMRDIMASARKHGVRILMDAEQSWYQVRDRSLPRLMRRVSADAPANPSSPSP